MTAPEGYYDQSVPPALLVGARRASAPAGVREEGTPDAGGQVAGRVDTAPAADQQPSPLVVTAGAPATYSPPLRAVDRPRNVTELNSAGATADPATPWPAGQYVSVGTSGKRAHWSGQEWRGGESPGYSAAEDSQDHLPRGANDLRPEAPPASESSASTPPVSTPPPPAPYTRPQFPGDEQDGDLTR